ncbi:MAG TPA: VOC family protein, partial [Acidimicrobiales bacterium]|nr:VOC family protein [Acidimicrobiales bacterium]
GWDLPDGPPEAGGYTVCELRGKTVAGLGPKMNPDFPTVWMSYVNVADADAAAERITAHGGTVFLAPMSVLDAGRMAIFADPAGAVLGLWQPGTHLGAQLANEPGAFCWNELLTTDVAGAKSFYGAVFGWEGVDVAGPEGGHGYTEWQLGGRTIGGMMPKTADMPAEMPPSWGVYFAVADADAAVGRIQALGGTLLMGPVDIDPGRFAVVADPQGAVFNVIALRG